MSGKIKIVILPIILSLFYIKINSQEFRVLYEYSFRKDSTNITSVEKEEMALDTDPIGSVFYSYPKFQFDSISIEKSKSNSYPNFTDKSQIEFFVEKNYSDSHVVLHTNLGVDKYAIKDNFRFDWKIFPEKDTIKGFNVQKATTIFGGRKWIAWYTSDILIFDGPYKFYGLPGLILKIEDSENHHVFNFLGIEKNIAGKSHFLRTRKYKEKIIDRNTFKKAWNDYKKDPSKSAKLLLLNSNTGMKITWEGKDYSVNDMIRNSEEMELEKIKKNNNFIELSLYK